MLIPCIDLMDGRVVQLVQGEKKALEFDDPEPWVAKFEKFPLVHIVDLSAAMRRGSNRPIIAQLAKRLHCQVGGGIRSSDDALQLLELGAQRVVVGSALVSSWRIDTHFAQCLANEIGANRLVFSVDAKKGQLAISGWKETVPISVHDAVRELEAFCSAFLYTNVDREGGMGGFPIEEARQLREITTRQLMVGGGINSLEQVNQLDSLNVDAIVGMAIYTGLIQS